MELAARFGLSRYPAPAGGCLLTDPGYAARLKELLSHNPRPSRRDLELLKWGRHFRLPGGTKVVVGRTHQENETLSRLVTPEDLTLRVQGFPGPLVLVPGGLNAGELNEAALLAASYSDAPEGREVAVTARQGGESRSVRVFAAHKDGFKEWLL